LVVPPQIAYAALRTGNFNSAVSALDNAMRDNPSVPLSPEALFFQALIQDLTGDRQRARLAYFDLWVAYPDSIWGGLAGAHLELRG
jgi:TolA-binding protein